MTQFELVTWYLGIKRKLLTLINGADQVKTEDSTVTKRITTLIRNMLGLMVSWTDQKSLDILEATLR